MNSTIARNVLAKVASPASVFGPDASLLQVTTPQGEVGLLQDPVSYESGATGVLVLARLLGEREVARDYCRWIELQLPTSLDPNAPGAQNALIGADLAAHLAPPDSGLGALSDRLRRIHHRKMDVEIRALETAMSAGRNSPGMLLGDVLTGLGRSLVISVSSPDEDSPAYLARGAEVLRHLLIPDQFGLVCRVDGPPFFGRAGDDLNAHWNFGFAHGASGIAFALVRVGEYLRRERVPAREIEASVRTYCGWLQTRFENLDVPMYAHDRTGSPEFVFNHGMPSWCYGTTGHALLLLAAGEFLQDSKLVETGVEAAVMSVERLSLLADISLCHGLAGVLAMITAGRAVSTDPRLEQAETLVRDRIVALYSAEKRYGFDYTPLNLGTPARVPGLLNGAAGVAIALEQSIQSGVAIDGAPWLIAPNGLLD